MQPDNNTPNNTDIEFLDDATNSNEAMMPSLKNEVVPENNAELVDAKPRKRGLKLPFKTNKSMPTLLAIILIVIFFCLGLYLGKTMFSTTIYANTRTNQNSNNNLVSNGKNNTTNVDGVTYKIPDAYIYDRMNNGVLIYDKDDNWRIFIRISDGNYVDVASAKTSISQTLKKQSINVVDIKEMKVNDKNYFTVETSIKMRNRLIAFTEANENKIFFIEIVTKDNNYNYDVLKIADDILKNAKYEAVSTEMEKIEVNDIVDLIVKTADEYKALAK